MVTLDVIRELMADLPGVEEDYSYGTRAFKVKKKLLARMHQKEDALVVKTDFDEREKLMQANSVTYYITDPYKILRWYSFVSRPSSETSFTNSSSRPGEERRRRG